MQSGTFIVPPDVYRIRVRVWGAGGSGGRSFSATTQIGKVASGGGGGGHGIKVVNTTPGTSYAVTVGTGGAAVTANGNGNAGGSSSFGTLVTCTGGGAGIGVAPFIAPGNANGGAGGTSTGGDVNYSGGRGGNIITTATLYNAGTHMCVASGGGASGSIFGNGFNGGDCNTTINGASAIAQSGGGGVGGRGGNITNSSNTSSTCGGGTAGDAEDVTSGVGRIGAGIANYVVYNGVVPTAANGIYTNRSGTFPAELRQSIYYLQSQASGTPLYMGQYPDNAVNRFPGDILMSASAARDVANLGDFYPPGCGMPAGPGSGYYAGAFGGGGGSAQTTLGVGAGTGSIGGGGGGYAAAVAGILTSSAGGNGMVIVEW